MEKQLLSYSGITKFCNCRKSFFFRYVMRIEPKKISDALSFGKLIHECLEAHHTHSLYENIIMENCKNKDNHNHHFCCLASAMMNGYNEYYKDDNFKVLDTELEYECYIKNPATDRKSRKYKIRGFIDMVIQRQDGIWLVEHKTAAFINENYIARLWHDFQIMLYAIMYERISGNKVKGIIYNVMQKVRLKQGKKETIEEYAERLKERYITDNSLFHREEILIDNLRLKEVETELWQITRDIGKCKDYYKNRSQCYVFGECEFFKICNSGDNPLIIKNYYKEREDDITNGKNKEEDKPF